MKQRRLGIVGAGAVVQQFYSPTLRSLRGDWAITVFDLNLERARSVAAPLGAEARVWGPEIGPLDAAIVATPPATHSEVVRTLLCRGTPVLCEKPFVTQLKDGDDLVRFAASRGLPLTVDQTRRFFPCSTVAKRLLHDGAIGQPHTVEIREGNRFSWPSMTRFYFDHRSQRNGVLADRGSHVFDLVSWLLGASLTPTAVITDGLKGPEATACVDFTGPNVQGTAILTWLADLGPELRIAGDRGELIIGENWNRLTIVVDGVRRHVWGKGRTKTFADLSEKVVSDFLGACEGRPSLSTAESVLPSIKFLDEAYNLARPEWPSELFEVTA